MRSKLQTKVFSALGSDATLETVASSTVSKWGDSSTTYDTGTTISVVPYNLIFSGRSYEAFGDLKAGETDMAIPYDISFGINDKITFDSVAYKVMQIAKFPLQGGNAIFIVRLTKSL